MLLNPQRPNMWVGASLTVSGTTGFGVGQTYGFLVSNDAALKPLWYRANTISAGLAVAYGEVAVVFARNVYKPSDLRNLRGFDYSINLESIVKISMAAKVVKHFPFLKNVRRLLVDFELGNEMSSLRKIVAEFINSGPKMIDKCLEDIGEFVEVQDFLKSPEVSTMSFGIDKGYLNVATVQYSYVKEFGIYVNSEK